LEKEPQALDYLAAILADMEAKKVALENAMAGIRTAIAIGALGPTGDFQGLPTASLPLAASGTFTDLPRGAFLGKTAREAITLYLSTIRKKQTNKEIAQALQEGGLVSAGDFDKYVTSALFRLKQDNVLLRFEDGWGLAEWYNEAFRTKVAASNNKPAKRTKTKRRKPAKKAAAQQALLPAPATPEAKPAQVAGIDARVAEFLESTAPSSYAVKQIAEAVRGQVGVVNFSLVRLAKKGIATRGEDGQYHATKEPE
jgi:hypothetical protein